MKFKFRSFSDRKQAKLARLEAWHTWFAWYPVRKTCFNTPRSDLARAVESAKGTDKDTLFWMEGVERRMKRVHNFGQPYWEKDYR